MEIGELVQAVVVAVVSFGVLGCRSVLRSLPLRRLPTPQLELPSGFGALACELVDGTSDVTAPSGRPCVGWQLHGPPDGSFFGSSHRAKGDWCDAIRVRLRSGEIVVLRLPETGLWISSERPLGGELDDARSQHPGPPGAPPRGSTGWGPDASVLLPGDQLHVVGVFVLEGASDDPMRRDGEAGRRASLAIPDNNPADAYAAVLHAGPYAALGWRGRRAHAAFVAPWPMWTCFYALYAIFFHALPHIHPGQWQRPGAPSDPGGAGVL